MTRFKTYYNKIDESIFKHLTIAEVKERQKGIVELKDNKGKVWTVQEIVDKIQPWNVAEEYELYSSGNWQDEESIAMWTTGHAYDIALEVLDVLNIIHYENHIDQIAEGINEKAIWPDETV